jgi:hypothetical protein
MRYEQARSANLGANDGGEAKRGAAASVPNTQCFEGHSEQRKQPSSEGIETARYALRSQQFNAPRAAEGFPVDEVLVTPGRLYFCGRLRRIVIKA